MMPRTAETALLERLKGLLWYGEGYNFFIKPRHEVSVILCHKENFQAKLSNLFFFKRFNDVL